MVFAEKIAPHCRRVSTFNMHVGNCAGLSGVKRCVEADLRHVFEAVHPVARKEPEPRFFPFAADTIVEEHRLSDRKLRRRGVRADFLKLAYVSRLLWLGGHQRPQFLNLVAFHVKHSCSLGRVEPLMQAGAKVIAAEVLLLEIKLSKRMGTVDDRLNSFRAGHVAHCFHRCDLPRKVYLMGDKNKFGSMGDSSFGRGRDVV